ncbi:MAG: lysylphosphatidylglycerol synthase transmembrane domain-containing protein [bacterium]|nr:lysylphosphatidylglycerol synthase transmembrane domain-containing protein [bacterium]
MKKILFFVISALIGIALFIGVIWHVGLDSIWQALNEFSFSKWFIVLFFNALQFMFTLYRWQMILKSQGYEVPLGKLAGPKLVGFSVDYMTPSPNVGGEAIRAYVLKKNTGVGLSPGLASIIIDKVMDFSYALPFLLFSIFYVLIKFDLSWKIIAGLLFVSGSFIFLMALFYYRTLRQKEFFGSIIRFLRLHRLAFVAKAMKKIGEFELIIIDFFRHDRKTFYRGLGLSILGGISVITSLWLIMYYLGLSANLLDVVLVSTLTVVTFLLPIPGSFGSTETGEVLIFSMLGFSLSAGVVFTLIFRSLDLLKVGIGFLFLSQFGLKIGQTIVKGESLKLAVNNHQNGEDKLNE